MSGATPRPWREADDSDHIFGKGSFVSPSGSNTVGRIYRDDDRALIVRAVNAHDALVAACDDARNAIIAFERNMDAISFALQESEPGIVASWKTLCAGIEAKHERIDDALKLAKG